jgi:hypothetical protein
MAMIELFFSYSHRDEAYRNELENHLAVLKRQEIETWHDRRIGAGRDIHGQISEYLERSRIILLLVSPYFLASDYCYDVEMKRALERHAAGEARVIPVIIHPCDWQNSPFGHLRATPKDGKPISKFPNKHDAYLSVVKDIRAAVYEIGGTVEEASEREEAPSLPSIEPTIVSEHRSSNLRIKKEFSDREKDSFLDDTFEYIAKYFENSLKELESRYKEVETSFHSIDRSRFTAVIYVQGQKRSSCRIWRGGSMVGDIGYAANDSGSENSFNEALSIMNDGYSLFLRPLGLQLFSSSGRDGLTAEGAAEYLWSILIDPLR